MSQRQTADLAIVGAGASGAHTLLAVLRELSYPIGRCARPMQIVIIDRDPEFFSGVAYGHRSGRASLTLSSLDRFLPDEERAGFVDWLIQHRDEVMDNPDIDSAWVDRHRDHIVAGRWEGLFVPRRLYGAHLAECVHAAMSRARSRAVAEFSFVNAAVTSLTESDNRHLVSTSDSKGGCSEIDAAVAILAIGSPPVRRLRTEGNAPADGLIHDIYDPGVERTLARLRARLVAFPESTRRILVVGGNAAALEFVLAAHPLIRDLGAVVSVLSPPGRPRHWRKKTQGESAVLPAITTLRAQASDGEPVTAEQLYEAIVMDLAAAVASRTDVAAVPDIMDAVPGLLDALGPDDRAALASRYGMQISNLLREDCGDAVDILNAGIDSGVIDFQAGRYVRSRYQQSYFDVTAAGNDGRERILDSRFAVIVGATGFEKISATRAPLIRQLLRDKVVNASSSDTGLHANHRFLAASRLFVLGPLLAGNANASMLIWHAESARRIIWIARTAAPFIVRELENSSSMDLLTV